MFLIRVELGFLGELDDAFLVLAPASRLRMARRYLRSSLGGRRFSLSGLLRVGLFFRYRGIAVKIYALSCIVLLVCVYLFALSHLRRRGTLVT